MLIRRFDNKDLDIILKLNNTEAQWVGSEKKSFFRRYSDIDFFYIAEASSKVCGFLMAMGERVDYNSENFLWFKKRYPRFYYIDRVIVSPEMRKKGIASELYKKLFVERKNIPLVCEVSVNPPNTESLKFHELRGFNVVGTFSADGKKVCSMYKLD